MSFEETIKLVEIDENGIRRMCGFGKAKDLQKKKDEEADEST